MTNDVINSDLSIYGELHGTIPPTPVACYPAFMLHQMMPTMVSAYTDGYRGRSSRHHWFGSSQSRFYSDSSSVRSNAHSKGDCTLHFSSIRSVGGDK